MPLKPSYQLNPSFSAGSGLPEILSSDKVGLRLNLAATWRYTDVLLAHEKLAKPAEHLYRELQFALRAAVGTRSLDALLESIEGLYAW